MKEMSTIKFPNQTEPYEIVDAAARKDIAGKSDIGHTHTRSEITDFAHDHDERYYTETEIDTKLSEAKAYTDTAATTVKNDLLNGAGAAYDTLKELGDLIDENTTALDALEAVASSKADSEHTHEIADVNGLEEALEAAASSGGSSWNDITDKPLGVGETETGDGAWLPMAADGVSYMGEEVSVPGTKWDETLTIYVIPSDTNQYRVTIDGVEYSASVDTSTGYSMLTLDGYDGPIHFSYITDDTGDHLSVMRTSTTDGTYSIKLERWSTSAGITTGWLTDGEGNNFAPKTLFSQVQSEDGVTLEEALEVQPDWNQNDETASDYVKNRTHWVEYAKTLLDSEVFECTTLASDSTSYYCAKTGNIGLIDGTEYNITVNGTTYTATALTSFGTNDIAIIAEIDKCRIYDRENGVVEVFTDTSSTLTISISETKDTYVQLDEKFIPDSFARSVDVELKMNKENPTGTGSLSINRASGSAVGENSIAIGTDCVASGASAVAIGSGASATGFASHAEGNGSIASGELSHAEGQDSKATGYASHAESSSEANGDYSHAEGYSIADGNYSHASGNGTWAVGRSQTVIGEANIEDSATDAATRGTYAVIVGNGDLDAGEYSNASTLDWSGNVWFAGTIKVGGTSYDEGSEVALKSDLSNAELITVDDIDAICGTNIQMASEVTY